MPLANIISHLNNLTSELEALFQKHPNCEDSDVRDHICAVLQSLMLEGELSPRIPKFFGVFNPLINMKIRGALSRFIEAPEVQSYVNETTLDDRISELKQALSEDEIKSSTGTPMTEVLGEWV